MEPLLDRWDRWLDEAGLSDPGRRVGTDVVARYAEPQRHYHTQVHLLAVLEGVDARADHADDLASVVGAAFIHDVIYDPAAADNEAASARFGDDVLTRLGSPESLRAEVARLVLATAGHDTGPGDRNGAVLCDADLAILAAPPDAYARYVEQVRAEYAFVSDEAWAQGRAHVLRGLLALPRLFHLPGSGPLDAQARRNLEDELSGLEPLA